MPESSATCCWSATWRRGCCAGQITALTWALEVGQPQRFASVELMVYLLAVDRSGRAFEDRAPAQRKAA